MSDLRARIAAVQRAHVPIDHAGGIECTCDGMGFPAHGGLLNPEQLWAEHVAAAVICELNLQPEVRIRADGPIITRLDGKVLSDQRRMHRYVTDWEADDE